ncbi:MAG: beta-hydroxyacyl-ACP dehydratase [Clostridiales bacterium]|nr:MAG: beta-hydroxyacyl-ACP dehydratase [Clostridiales bacterium]
MDGHFPGSPVVPGVILCEIMAQSICVLMSDKMEKNTLPYFTGLDKVKFKSPVKPGDTFETECKIVRVHEPFYFASGTGRVNGKVAVKADFSFAIIKKMRCKFLCWIKIFLNALKNQKPKICKKMR